MEGRDSKTVRGSTGSEPPSDRQSPGSSLAERRMAVARQRRAEQRKAGAQPLAAAPAKKGGGMPLPDGTREQMEESFGANFSSVRVHADSPTEQVGAIAYTRGRDIHFGAGQYNPE